MHTNKSENEYYRVLKDMQDFVTKKCKSITIKTVDHKLFTTWFTIFNFDRESVDFAVLVQSIFITYQSTFHVKICFCSPNYIGNT